MKPVIDLSGKRLGRWTVIRRVGTVETPNGSKRPTWLCVCDCGNEKEVVGPSLRLGYSRSCGCLVSDTVIARSTTHGQSPRSGMSRERSIWNGMKQRCGNPNDQNYDRYGGRGIRVCKKWLHDFAAFYRDMGPAPAGYTLDRINNDGNYTPRNCRWASRATQRVNQSSRVHWVTIDGRKMTSSEAATLLGVSRWKVKQLHG